LNGFDDAPSNNGMHPTPHQRAFHVRCEGARVMPGVVRFAFLMEQSCLIRVSV
jgi:hypothetical protein